MVEQVPDCQHRGVVCVATITSRPEAFVIASALEHEGIPVWINGAWHASIDPMSIALGGHRLTVPGEEWGRASALIREIGLPGSQVFYRGGKLAVMKFVLLWLGSQLFFAVPLVVMGAWPVSALFWVMVSVFGVQVDPRGQNDYYLAAEASS